MEKIKDIFRDNEVKTACLAALEGRGELERALELIYIRGFEHCITLPGSEKLFAARLMEMQREYSEQLAACGKDPRSWLDKQLEITADSGINTDYLCAALCRVTAEQHGDKWQKQEMEKLLLDRAKFEHSAEENRRLMEAFAAVPLEGIFEAPRLNGTLSRERGEALAAILAMALYVKIKREPPEYIPADMSFDAVSLWSRAAVEARFIYQSGADEREKREKLSDSAMVGAVMGCQYMGVGSWQIMSLCAAALLMLGYLLEKLTRLVLRELPLEQTEEEKAIKAVEEREYDMEKGMISLLRKEKQGREEKWMQQELEKILHRENEDEEGIRIKETN